MSLARLSRLRAGRLVRCHLHLLIATSVQCPTQLATASPQPATDSAQLPFELAMTESLLPLLAVTAGAQTQAQNAAHATHCPFLLPLLALE